MLGDIKLQPSWMGIIDWSQGLPRGLPKSNYKNKPIIANKLSINFTNNLSNNIHNENISTDIEEILDIPINKILEETIDDYQINNDEYIKEYIERQQLKKLFQKYKKNIIKQEKIKTQINEFNDIYPEYEEEEDKIDDESFIYEEEQLDNLELF
jgi:hypothetical protein